MSEAEMLVLIPALKPDERMVSLCGELRNAGLSVLIVDDGSGEPYRHFFESAQSLGCVVMRHAVNLGKGRALKTGINAALTLFSNLSGVITADADGQHTCKDILRVAQALESHPGALILGGRRFQGTVPFRSRAGNMITRHVYRFVTGFRCHDTQTGLRGIPSRAMGRMLSLSGERYEFEMNMLLNLRDFELSLHEIEIETIYIDNNSGSHFRALRDGGRIYYVILRFVFASLLSFGVDYFLYLLCLQALALPAWLCYAGARVVSSLFNYALNRLTVFNGRGAKASLLRYYLLASAQLAVGAGLVEALHVFVGFGAGWVKIPVDAVLFLLSFVLQRDFVFGNKWKAAKKPKERR